MRFPSRTVLLCVQPIISLASAALTVNPASKGGLPEIPRTESCFVDSLAAAAKITITGMLSYYGGDQRGQVPGIFNEIEGYYWWMAGAAWNVPIPTQTGTDICSH